MTLSILAAAQEQETRPFLVAPERTLSFKQVAERVVGAMGWLQENGVSAGQETPFALTASNELRSIVVLLALLELGVPALLLHPKWTEIERARVLKRAEVAVAPLPDEFGSFRSSTLPLASGTHDPERTVAVVFTSGSSGSPRGVCLSRRAFLAAAEASRERLDFRTDDRWLLSLPLAHVGGLSILTRCLLARKPLVLPSLRATEGGFRPAEMLKLIGDCKISLLSLVPTQLLRLVESSFRCPPQVRAVLLGGARPAPQLLKRAARAGWPIHRTYGLTEACSQVTLEAAPSDPEDGSDGTPLDGTEIRIAANGQIAIRSRTLLSGYFGSETAALDQDGWFTTQDMGSIDERGRLHVQGRSDEVIISGGENVHPLEVECVLLDHPAIVNACVFGVPSEEWGEEVAVAIVARPGHSLADLPTWLEARFSAFRRPRRATLVNELPTTASGKLSRLRARQMFSGECRPWSELDL
ncbi:MAG TPA: AMP-binding protein [Polyangiaceae bacterium]|jgi:O-succinylbenzoic acid--CoA ligase|nr:AMP-binding protein [Polyangiaceae bacterium]